MSLIVQKFGGSSVANAERIRNVARIVTDAYSAGNQMVVVVSAQGDTTDDLIAKASEINPRASKREMDMLLSTGEQISIALLAMCLEGMGYSVKSLTGWQAGFSTDSNHGGARIRSINTDRLENELSKNNIVIVAGFQGLNRYDDITTLGRGGSDTSAVALAAALHADKCQIFTDVDGVYTADPRLVKNAIKLDEISYDEMLELASLGAQVLHNRSVEMAKKYGVDLEVLSSLERKPGTKVKEVVDVEKLLIRGVTKDDKSARVSVVGIPDVPGTAFQLFTLLGKYKINVDVILQSLGQDHTQEISFTVPMDQLQTTIEVLNDAKETMGFESVAYNDNISKVSIVGAGMATNPGVASKMFGALYEANINIHMISTSEIKISVLIDRTDSDKAVVAIHNAFYA